MPHRLLREDPGCMVVDQHAVNKVKDLVTDKVLILRGHKFRPWLPSVPAPIQSVVEGWLQLKVILVEVCEEVICAKDFRNLHELVTVVLTMKEGLLFESHASEHAAQAPDVKRVVIKLQVDE